MRITGGARKGLRVTIQLPVTNTDAKRSTSRASHSIWVASGIFLSRLAGLVRERVFAHYFGNSDAGDAFKAALKIPNVLQNLFGEGVLSASFIPVYARLLALDERETARRVAWSVAAMLSFIVSLLVLGGVLATPFLIDAIAPGFGGEKRALTIRIVQILFPATGVLVLSAWCLGVLNSHRRFFLSYSAPVLWNLAIIATLVYFGSRHDMDRLATDAAWGLFAGSVLQLMAQLPFAWRAAGALGKARAEDKKAIRQIGRSFVPVVMGRGVVQVSAYVDNMIASLLPTGAVSAVSYAQTLYLLPISLFGMAVSAAELPELAAVGAADETSRAKLRHRLEVGLVRISFFVVPSVAGFLFLGDTITAAIFQTGEFSRNDTTLVWMILCAASVGLVPATRARLLSSGFYALGNTKTPLQLSLLRVTIAIAAGYFAATRLPEKLGYARIYGTVGLTFASAIAGWIEYGLLKTRLESVVGPIRPGVRARNRTFFSALLAGAMSFAAKIVLQDHLAPIPAAFVLVGLFGAVYFVAGALMGIEESKRICARVGLRLG